MVVLSRSSCSFGIFKTGNVYRRRRIKGKSVQCYCYAVGGIYLFILPPWFDSTCPLGRKHYCKSIQSSSTWSLLWWYFYSEGRGLVQDDPAPIHRAWGLAEWLKKRMTPAFSNPTKGIFLRWIVFFSTVFVNAKVHWSCSGSLCWSNTSLICFMLGFPFICHTSL